MREYATRNWIRDIALKYDSDECLLWPFGVTPQGYGGLYGRTAHNLVCELTHGPHPTGENEAAHSCGQRLCVNPRHLRWASEAGNAADRVAHGTQISGEAAKWSLLDDESVRIIRLTKGQIPDRRIAAEFGVSRGAVSAIRTGKSWKHV